MISSSRIIAIVGGAVAGAEAAGIFSQHGISCVVLDQNSLPYGKIADGLPIWHVRQRQKEMDLIDEKIGHPLVSFVPRTKVGRDIPFGDLFGLGWSAVILANGAWHDRPFPVPHAEKYLGRGFYYQNPLVYWFNHHREPDYSGPGVEVADGAIVIGGGLASLDVVKILQLEVVERELVKRGISVDICRMEHEGIPKTLAEYGLTYQQLGIQGCQLIYRRVVEDMPLAPIPPDATEERISQIRVTVRKILRVAQDKYCFRFQDRCLPIGISEKEGSVAGLRVISTEVREGRAVPISDTEEELPTAMVVSSIGSIPELYDGIPFSGHLYDIEDSATGKLRGMERVFAIGNAVTGRGNIQVSRQSARNAVPRILETGVDPVSDEKRIRTLVAEWQGRVGFDGNYRAWVDDRRRKTF